MKALSYVNSTVVNLNLWIPCYALKKYAHLTMPFIGIVKLPNVIQWDLQGSNLVRKVELFHDRLTFFFFGWTKMVSLGCLVGYGRPQLFFQEINRRIVIVTNSNAPIIAVLTLKDWCQTLRQEFSWCVYSIKCPKIWFFEVNYHWMCSYTSPTCSTT
jgi:hypothetical protein